MIHRGNILLDMGIFGKVRAFNPDDGFALPTVIITSVVMMIVLLAGLTATTSISGAIHGHYMESASKDATRAGLVVAQQCINKGITSWTKLHSGDTCTGSVVQCTNSASCFVMKDDENNIRTTFEVSTPVLDGDSYKFSIKGSIYRKSYDGSINSTSVYENSVNGVLKKTESIISNISAGYKQTCAIMDGITRCWGANPQGQLGNGTYSSSTTLTPEPMVRQAGGLLGKTDKIVSVGNEFACVATTDDDIYCTGKNDRGELGINSKTRQNVPTKVIKPASMNGKTITDLAAGNEAICAVASGDAYCWGSSSHGLTALNTTTIDYLTPQLVTSAIGNAASRPVVNIETDATAEHFCAIAKDGSTGLTYCWGYNGRGELGINSTADKSVPVQSTALWTSLWGMNISKIEVSGGPPRNRASVGDYPSSTPTPHDARSGHTCAKSDNIDWGSNGQMHCWGANQYGQLGQGSVPSNPWRQIVSIRVNTSPLNGKTIADVSTTISSSCALVPGEDSGRGNIYCFGLNEKGQLGRNTLSETICSSPGPLNYQCSIPVLVTKTGTGLATRTIVDIFGGSNRHCAQTSDSKIFCWGANDMGGQIGDGTLVNRSVPTELSAMPARYGISSNY
jgi:alpha-tubulin suppressor-like RCC1 family protein